MKPAVVMAALVLGSCSPQFIATVTPVCDATTIIWISKSDKLTPHTASQIEGNNLAHEKLCGPSPRPPRSEPAPKKAEAKTS